MSAPSGAQKARIDNPFCICDVQGARQHLHSSLGPMGREPRYRVCGRDLCCLGFVPARSGGRRPFGFRRRGPPVGRRDVALDDHVAPV